MPKILVIEDDVSFCKLVEKFLTKNGYEVSVAFSATEAKIKTQTENFDLILTDLRLPDSDGMTLLTDFKRELPSTPVILMTGYSDINTAVKAIKNGATDYISKPFNPDEVLIVVANALKNKQIQIEPEKVSSKKKDPISKTENSEFVMGISPASLKLAEYIKLVSPTDISVLIVGESGTGKEVIAQKIHKNSNRNKKPFIAVDCGTILKDLAASEFFGHIKGSFTGALNDKIGYFEAANGGTIFLDEIGNLPNHLQAKLLQVIQNKEIIRLGESSPRKVDVRIIVATNANLENAVKEGHFREDLYYRINTISVTMPNLSERKEDIKPLIDYFLELFADKYEVEKPFINEQILLQLENYNWNGNIRELQNRIERAVILAEENEITIENLGFTTFIPQKITDNSNNLNEIERNKIVERLHFFEGNISKTAENLGVSRAALYRKLEKYNITNYK